MRKVLALALIVAIALVGVPAQAIAAAAGQAKPKPVTPREKTTSQAAKPARPRSPDKPHQARRLGGPTTFYNPSLTSIDTLRTMARNDALAEDVRKVLADGGVPETADAVLAAMRDASASDIVPTGGRSCTETPPVDGSFVECDFPRGAVLEWMAVRPNAPKGDRTPGILQPVKWVGQRPFSAFLFRVVQNNNAYTFVVPKECGNLALLGVVALPPPPPAPPPAPVTAAPPPPAAPVVVQPPPAPAAPQAMTGSLECRVLDAAQRPVANAAVRLIGPNGQVVATGMTDANGVCLFTGLAPGNYVVELVNPAGAVVGTSALTAVAAGATATAAVAHAAVGALAAAGGAGGLFGLGHLGTAVLLGSLGALGFYAVHQLTKDEASPSR